MSFQLKSRCVIPTNSLCLIYNEIGDKFDDLVSYVRATSQTTDKTEKRQPHKFMRIHNTESTRYYLRYRRAMSREPFSIEEIIETMQTENIADLWIHELHLALKHDLGRFNFIFKNAPITEGTEAHKFVQNYMQDLIRTGWITRAQLRHLPLTGTRSIPPGGNLSQEKITSPEFIAWLSEQTDGLMRLKLIQRKDETTYIDYAIKNIV